MAFQSTRPRVGLFAFDFDETITTRPSFAEFDRLFPATWPELDRHYISGYEAAKQLAESKSSEGIHSYLEAFRDSEIAAIEKAMEMQVFAGSPRTLFYQTGQALEKRPGCVAFFDNVQHARLASLSPSVQLQIISMNWSRDLIHGAVDPWLSGERIVSNDLVYTLDDICTGDVTISVVSALEKLHQFRKARRAVPFDSWSVFVGDGSADTLAAMEADIGILIVPNGEHSGSTHLLERFGIVLKSLPDSMREDSRGLYRARSWDDIHRFFAG